MAYFLLYECTVVMSRKKDIISPFMGKNLALDVSQPTMSSLTASFAWMEKGMDTHQAPGSP